MDIVGTTITVNDFFKKETITLHISNSNKELNENRIYNIPSFQRELRWGKRQVFELLRDLSSNSIFLGNIILNEKNNIFSIIDGQQRITIIKMIYDFINNRYKSEIGELKYPELKIENFESYDKFVKNEYSLNNLSQDEIIYIEEKDYYKQIQKYEKIYEEISNSSYLNNITNVRKVLSNLSSSIFNIVISTSTIPQTNLNYFIDVNLKGIKLDTEDIFAGYLFSIDNLNELKPLWRNLKANNFAFNDYAKTKSRNYKDYTVVEMVEHFLYSKIYEKEKYKNLVFNSKFELTKDISLGEGDNHFSGEHIISAIPDVGFFKETLKQLNQTLTIANDIIKNSSGRSSSLKNLLINLIDDNEITVINEFLCKILLENKFTLPKALILKYIFELIKNQDSLTKNLIKSIYNIIVYIMLFYLLNLRKKIEQISPMLKANDIEQETVKSIQKLFSNEEFKTNISKAQVFINENTTDESSRFKTQMVAACYNYFVFSGSKYTICSNQFNNLYSFLTNKENYSIEHLIINDSEKILLDDINKEFKYNENIKNMKDNFFNYIFIPKTINLSLHNKDLKSKLEILNNNKENIHCDYSLEMLKSLNNNNLKFKEMDYTIEDYQEKFQNYYENDFNDDYNKIKNEMIEKFVNKIKPI